ncbi:DUF4352 domain-containing protein [Virgibacillus oceani]|uniref:DUF4352 domain-containing protein n=1 Tax=Virgibacillus oceani TaxID=1479511 RepID=A0A917LXU9_9BACI|nr:DUF4352 domain-containing protein [Virgibacillus oceani]GGG62960.1 hypothetical protein GCM10011398_02930 [Virgibacillus oceani]
MKKILLLFLFTFALLAGCSDDSGDNNDSNNSSDSSESNEQSIKTDSEEKQEDKSVYQIGETATITSDSYDFDYEVTVTDFNLANEVNDVTIEEFIAGAGERDKFAVVDVTIKNISDEAYVPNEMFSANFSGFDEEGGHVSIDEFFTVGDKKLEPGDELKGHLVYTTTVDYADKFLLKYEVMSDEETHFVLPNPEM